MSTDDFDDFKRDFEQASSWPGATHNPIKGSNGARDVEAELDIPVVFVASEFEWKLPNPVGQDPAVTAAKAAKAAKARKSKTWLCNPIAIEDMYLISAAIDAPPVAPEPQPVSCLDAALQWAKRGYAVFPSPPNTKKSYKSGKVHGGARWGATKDLAEIERDWKRWPDANLGLPCDAANGFFVIEADTLEGHPNLGEQDGFATLAALEIELGPLPETLMSESPSGSRHRFYKQPPGDPIHSKDGWRHGVDVKGEGGMAIIPPSCKGDKVYWWIMS